MPHSSRKKKKNFVPKRIEVVGENGWTRVTTTKSNPQGHTSTALPSPGSQWETVPEKGISVKTISKRYHEIEEQWLASDSCGALVALLKKQALTRASPIDKCMVFGTGSFCGLWQGWIQRHSVAMCQLAVLRTMQRTIEEVASTTLLAFAQDPAYNSLDVDFLRTLDIEAVTTPEGFAMVTKKSLAYTPGAEMHVDIQVLKRQPAILLTGKLDWYWRNEKGSACTNRVMPLIVTSSGEMERDGLHNDYRLLAREGECQILEDYRKRTEEARLPEFEFKDHPFKDQYLYWSSSSVHDEGPDAIIAGNLDFDARVPIPISVFPSTYRSDAASVETTTKTRVDGEVNQGAATQRVGREDTRFRKQEETVDVRTYGNKPQREERPDEYRVVEESRTRVNNQYPSNYQERQYTNRQVGQTERIAEVDLSRERYQAPSEYRRETQVNLDVTDSRPQGSYDYTRKTEVVRDQPITETQIDITEREFRRKTQPNYDIEYERRRPIREDVVIEKDTVREVKVDKESRGTMGDTTTTVNTTASDEASSVLPIEFFIPSPPTIITIISMEMLRQAHVESSKAEPSLSDMSSQDVGRPCQVIRISQSDQTGQYRYLGVDLFTRQLHEESSFVSNPEPSVVVQSMLGPVFKQYRILDLNVSGLIVGMTETGDVKQGLPVIDQGGLYSKISRAFKDGCGSVRALVINDGGRELIVDYKVIHGSRL